MAGAALPVRPGGASAASGAALRLRRAARLRRRAPLQPLAFPAGAPAPRELQPGPAADVLGAGPAAPVDERRPPRRADRRRGVPGRHRPRGAGPRPRAGRGGRRPTRVRRLLTSAHRDELTRTAARALGPGPPSAASATPKEPAGFGVQQPAEPASFRAAAIGGGGYAACPGSWRPSWPPSPCRAGVVSPAPGPLDGALPRGHPGRAQSPDPPRITGSTGETTRPA